MKNVLVVFNPNAGRKNALKFRKILQKFLLQNVENFKFISISELSQLDTAPYDTIIAMGGDGTINEVVKYIANTDKKLAIIPCGTANLLAEKLKIPTNIYKAVKILKNDNARMIDAVKINDNLSVLRFGAGFDSDIICKTPQSLKNKFGYFAYFVAGILFALRLKKKEYEIITKSEKKTVSASCVIISNASNMYHNWFSVGKNTEPDDGLFDVFLLKTQNSIILFFELIKIAFGYYKNSKYAEFFKTDSLVLKNKWMNTHIDGDEYKFKDDISFEILKSAIKVIV